MMKVRSTPKEHHASYVQLENDTQQTTSQSMEALRGKKKALEKRRAENCKKRRKQEGQ